MGLMAMSSAPNCEEALRAANGYGHNTYVDEGQWLGDPSGLNQLGLGDACYGMPGLGMGDDNTGQQVVQAIQAIANPFIQIQQQKLALKQQAIAAHQAKMQQGSGGGMTQGSGLPPDIEKWLLYLGIAIVAGIIIMSLLKKKKGGGGEAAEKHEAHKHTVIDEEIGI